VSTTVTCALLVTACAFACSLHTHTAGRISTRGLSGIHVQAPPLPRLQSMRPAGSDTDTGPMDIAMFKLDPMSICLMVTRILGEAHVWECTESTSAEEGPELPLECSHKLQPYELTQVRDRDSRHSDSWR
jgi:hypothetical protein